jgi:hypothetical protein
MSRKEYSYDWPEFSYSSTTADCLESHINTVHMNVRLFKCQNCDKSYECLAFLRKHFKLSHSSESVVHKCEKCGYCTKSKTAFNKHLMRHSVQKPHKC